MTRRQTRKAWLSHPTRLFLDPFRGNAAVRTSSLFAKTRYQVLRSSPSLLRHAFPAFLPRSRLSIKYERRWRANKDAAVQNTATIMDGVYGGANRSRLQTSGFNYSQGRLEGVPDWCGWDDVGALDFFYDAEIVAQVWRRAIATIHTKVWWMGP